MGLAAMIRRPLFWIPLALLAFGAPALPTAVAAPSAAVWGRKAAPKKRPEKAKGKAQSSNKTAPGKTPSGKKPGDKNGPGFEL